LRIISGWAKGRKLVTPPAHTDFIRPTSDRAREALFNIIGSQIENGLILDLFAGTGALGLESLSRGAKYVVFIDNHPKALATIKKNIKICYPATNMADQRDKNSTLGNRTAISESQPPVTVLKRDLKKMLRLSKSSFDLVFIDPPYSKGLALHCLRNLVKSMLPAANGLIIVEERSNETLPESIDHFMLVDQRRYGDTAFWFYKEKKKNLFIPDKIIK